MSSNPSLSKHKIILTEHLAKEARRWLAERANVVEQSYKDIPAFQHELSNAVGLLVRTYTQVNDELLEKAPRLKVVGRAGVGLDNIDLEACLSRGIQVVHTPNANTQAVVEYVWALLFDALRPRVTLTPSITPEQFHSYRKTLVGQQIGDMTLGILGMGRIGRRLAQIAQAFGLRVIYNDLLTQKKLKLPETDRSIFVEKATLWKQSDILTLHTDGRPENHHLITKEVLEQLQPHCVLLNTARGMLIKVDDLVSWAHQVKEQGGQAILDVNDPEPPPSTSPLYGLSNIRLLPHLASRTTRAMLNMSWVVRDVYKVLQGQPPQWPAI